MLMPLSAVACILTAWLIIALHYIFISFDLFSSRRLRFHAIDISADIFIDIADESFQMAIFTPLATSLPPQRPFIYLPLLSSPLVDDIFIFRPFLSLLR